MLGRLVRLAIIAALIALVVQSLPDIKRYWQIRRM
jgi:hypothetical protein